MTSSRLEAFSDGVFSIAATLLVLQLQVPLQSEPDFARALASQWPTYASYVVSFMTIGIIWINHHTLFSRVREVDRPLLLLNLLLLLSVSTIPFPTAMLGRTIGGASSHVAAAVYGGVMVSMSLSFSALWMRVSRGSRQPRRPLVRAFAGLGAYVLGTALAFVSAEASLLVFGAVAVFYLFPPRSDTVSSSSASPPNDVPKTA
jgi:uncharacterized membrane protein